MIERSLLSVSIVLIRWPHERLCNTVLVLLEVAFANEKAELSANGGIDALGLGVQARHFLQLGFIGKFRWSGKDRCAESCATKLCHAERDLVRKISSGLFVS